MPPIKGRMLNLQRSTAPIHCYKSAFSSKRHLRPKNVTTIGKQTAEKALKKLRIPELLCRSLPSVRKFKDREAEITESSKASTIDPSPVIILDDDEDIALSAKDYVSNGAKKSKNTNRYHAKQVLEAKFGSMIWDVAFILGGGIVVSHVNGAILCDDELGIKKVLENVRLGGGVAVYPNGRIAVICRFNDTVNIYAPDGNFLKSFSVGLNPTSLAINSRDELVISDIGEKCIVIADDNGKILRSIPSCVSGRYSLQWPGYVAVLPDDEILVCDVHLQRVLRFNSNGAFEELLSLRTIGNQELLRPHGVCFGPADNILVVDSATDSVEVFTRRGRFVQTLFSIDEGRQLKVKVIRVDNANRRLLIGGLTGTVKLLHFVDLDAANAVVEIDAKVPALLSAKKEPFASSKMKVEEVIVLD